MKAIGYIFTTVFVIAFSCVVNGYALAKLWAWFVVPTFAVPLLTIPAAIGLAMVVSYLTHNPDLSKKEEKPYWETLLTGFIWAILKPSIALLFGSIVKLWM
jgi:hypothetical protein